MPTPLLSQRPRTSLHGPFLVICGQPGGISSFRRAGVLSRVPVPPPLVLLVGSFPVIVLAWSKDSQILPICGIGAPWMTGYVVIQVAFSHLNCVLFIVSWVVSFHFLF